MDTLPPLQRGKGIFVNLTLDGICRLHLSGGHAKILLRIYEEAARWGDKDRSAAPKKAGNAMEKRQKTSLTMCLVAIGIVYGDIGTSPLYVMKSILEGNGGITQINESFIVGALSLIIWTITLLTTIKYVLIAMKADNHGEGGIFSLYSLVRSCGKWLIVPAMLGGAALLADGVLTPAVTVTSAVEGLRSIAMMDRLLGGRQTGVIIITLCIIASLFAVQHAGTSRIGKAFGPVMLVWFLFLGATGAMNIFSMPQVLRAFNPAHAVELLVSPYNKLGFMILGSVFLAATGAEALYSDMGHVGRESIYISWPLVKICLILNYLGQGAWLLSSRGDAALASLESLNPFFLMLPGALRPVAVILSALAAVIASQALITGSYTLVSEAIRLDLMPHLKVQYPAETKGQIYIDTVNKILWVGCTFIVLLFRSSARMESAYGLAITVTMLMTTLLLFVYLSRVRGKKALAWGVLIVFGAIETVFFLSSLSKFAHGGYVAVIMALLLLSIMIIWHRGTQLEQKYSVRLKLGDYTENLAALRGDSALPELTQNLVYIGSSDDMETIDRNTLYSILDKDPKRPRLLVFECACARRAKRDELSGRDVWHGLYFPRKAQPRLQERPAREHLPAPDRARPARERGTATAGEKVFDLRPLAGGQLQVSDAAPRGAADVGAEPHGRDHPEPQIRRPPRGGLGHPVVRTGHLVGHCGAGAAGHPQRARKRKAHPAGEMNQKGEMPRYLSFFTAASG